MTTPTNTLHRLEVCRTRLLALKQNPQAKFDDIMFYEVQIDELEAELAVATLMDEMEAPKVWKVYLDDWSLVRDICKYENVISMRIGWNWRMLKFVWYVEYTILPKCWI